MSYCTVVAKSKAASHPRQAKKLGKASAVLMSAGIFCTIAFGVAAFAMWFSMSCHRYNYEGRCYTYRSDVDGWGSCDLLKGIHGSDGYCYFDYCRGVVYNQGCYAYKIYVGNVNYCNWGGAKSPDGFCYHVDCPYHKYERTCYRNKTYVGSSSSCPGDISPNGFCYNTYCTSKKFPTECYKYKTRHFGSWDTTRCAVIARDGNYYESCYSNSCDDYVYRGGCYKYRDYVGNSSSCRSIYSVSSTSGYCYTNCHEYRYYYAGFCYNSKLYVDITDTCTGVISPDNYCYFD